jgi:predicted amidophosphoribosyltransferase
VAALALLFRLINYLGILFLFNYQERGAYTLLGVADGTPSSGLSSLRSSVRSWLTTANDALLSIIFPAGCRICDELLTDARRVPICDTCFASFQRIPQPFCEVCGRPLPGLTPQERELALCPACRDKTYAFDLARSFAIYEGSLVRAILLLKFEQIEPLGKWFAKRLAEIVLSEGNAMAADVVVPVPLHRDRQRERGYNQAALISKPLARRLPAAPQGCSPDAHPRAPQ